MHTFLDLAKERRSVRTYIRKSVPRETLEHAIEAARLAPSAHNQQPWKFIIVDDHELIAKIAAACTSPAIPFNKFVPSAPAIVAVVSEKSNIATMAGSFIKRRPFHLIDLGIAAEHFCLQAQEDGLGTCMIGWFNERKVKRILKVPFTRRLHLLIAAGYSDNTRVRTKKRKELSQIISYNEY